MDLFMQGSTGVFQTVYAGTQVTVRIMECPELDTVTLNQQGLSAWLAVITYKKDGEVGRIDTDRLTIAQRNHCKEYAGMAVGLDSPDYKTHMAKHYWCLIK